MVPDNVRTVRLIGGDYAGHEVPVEPRQETLRLGPPFLVLTDGDRSREERERVMRTASDYRFSRVEESELGPRAVFEFVSHIEIASGDDGRTA